MSKRRKKSEICNNEAIAADTPLDDYDTDVTTEENNDSNQPKEEKLYNAKGFI